MIRIRRQSPPKELVTLGKIEVSKIIANIARGDNDPGFKSEIYGLAKNKLSTNQYGKCCYCETKMFVITYGDIEHFRPKAAVKISGRRSARKPGYYWLAYDWDNLLLSCERCNRSHKRNNFPLVSENRRASNENDDLSLEEPLLIDPYKENPSEFISFHRDVPYAIANREKGRLTIKHLGLERIALCEVRRLQLEMMEALYDIVKIKPPIPEALRARQILKRLLAKKSDYLLCKRVRIRELSC